MIPLALAAAITSGALLCDCDPALSYSAGGAAPIDQAVIAGVADPVGGHNFSSGTTGSGASGPTYVAKSAINGLPALRFQAEFNGSYLNHVELTISSSLTFNGSATSVYTVLRGINACPSSNGNTIFFLGVPGSTGALLYVLQDKFNFLTNGTGGTGDTPTPQISAIGESPTLVSMRMLPASVQKLGIDGINYNLSNGTAQTYVGGQIGNTTDGSNYAYAFNGEFQRQLIFNGALSDADHALVMSYLEKLYGIPAGYNSQITLGQDSNVMAEWGTNLTGGGLNYGQSILCQAAQAGLISKTTKMVNQGIPGQQVAGTQSVWFTSLLNTAVTGVGGHVVVFVAASLNDFLSGGKTPAQLLTLVTTMGQTLRNAGLRFIVTGMCDSAPSWGVQASATAFNALLAANWPTFADAYIPPPSSMVPQGTTNGAANYLGPTMQNDGLHWSALGQAAWVPLIAPVANRLLNLAGVGLASSSGITTTSAGTFATGAAPTTTAQGAFA